jgi:hypothetical protein
VQFPSLFWESSCEERPAIVELIEMVTSLLVYCQAALKRDLVKCGHVSHILPT